MVIKTQKIKDVDIILQCQKSIDIKHARGAGFHNPCGFVTDTIYTQSQHK